MTPNQKAEEIYESLRAQNRDHLFKNARYAVSECLDAILSVTGDDGPSNRHNLTSHQLDTINFWREVDEFLVWREKELTGLND